MWARSRVLARATVGTECGPFRTGERSGSAGVAPPQMKEVSGSPIHPRLIDLVRSQDVGVLWPEDVGHGCSDPAIRV
jgi:hypothetical protein